MKIRLKYVLTVSFTLLCLLFYSGCNNEKPQSNVNDVKTENNTDAGQTENVQQSTSVETTSAPIINPDGMTLESRFNAPSGYERTTAEEGSMTSFLRNYSLKKDGAPVLLYDGDEKWNQSAHAAVFKLPIENADLQQCADSVMRVYAEYYRSIGEYEKISFHFTNGFECSYAKWIQGYRVNISGNDVSWTKSAGYDESYESFVKYMRVVFSYAGTMSMDTYESEHISLSKLKVGDVILKGGSPGHVVMVVDMCKNADGKKAFLLAQGYMPAQEFHVIVNPLHEENSWYFEDEMEFPLKTAEYIFDDESMIRRLKY